MSETVQEVSPQRAWLERVLQIDFSGLQGQEPPGLRARLNETGLNVRQMARTEDGPELVSRFTEAVNAMKASDWDTVEEILDEIEPTITEGLSGARGDEAASVIRAANAWRDACSTVSASIETLKAHVLTQLRAEDEHTEEELDDISAELDAKLDPIAARLKAGLADQVDAAINASSDRQTEAMQKVLERIATIEGEFTGDAIIPIVEGNGSMPISISATALGALGTLRKALADRVGR